MTCQFLTDKVPHNKQNYLELILGLYLTSELPWWKKVDKQQYYCCPIVFRTCIVPTWLTYKSYGLIDLKKLNKNNYLRANLSRPVVRIQY